MWQKKEGKFHFSSSAPLFRRGLYNLAKTGFGTQGLPQGCPGDAQYPGVIHLVEEVLWIVHVLHRGVFMVLANQVVWVDQSEKSSGKQVALAIANMASHSTELGALQTPKSTYYNNNNIRHIRIFFVPCKKM